MSVPVWQLQIDWSGNGSWGDAGEDVTARVLADKGVTWERGRDQLRELAPPMAGTFAATLDNRSRDYSPANGASPLAGTLVPGRRVRWRANGATVWKGNLDDLPQAPALGARSVGVPALGALAKLRGNTISTDLYTNITTDAAFAYACRAAGLAAGEYQALDSGKTTLTAWWCANEDAFAMLTRILAAEGPGAAIYEDGAGVVTFHSRHYRLLNARATTSQATFSDTATSPFFTDLAYNPNLKGVINSCTISQATLALAGGPSTALWTYQGPAFQLAPGQSRAFDMVLSSPAQAGVFVLYAATAPDGTTPLLTSTFTRYDPATSAYVTANSGTYFRVTVTNGTALLATVTALSLNGSTTTTVTDTVAHSIDASASQAKYGMRARPSDYDPWPYIDPLVARDFCDAIVASYQEPRATVTLAVPNADATALGHQLGREVSDRVTVVDAQTGLSTPAYIERIKHTLDEAGRRLVTEFGCEVTAAQAGWFVMDSSAVDTGKVGF